MAKHTALHRAINAVEKAREKLASAEAKLAPLAIAAAMEGFQSSTGRRAKTATAASGTKRTYNISPEKKIAKAAKTATTRAIKAGKSKAEAKKIGEEAGEAMAAKLK